MTTIYWDKLQQKYPQLATSIKSKLKEIDSQLFQDPSTDSSASTPPTPDVPIIDSPPASLNEATRTQDSININAPSDVRHTTLDVTVDHNTQDAITEIHTHSSDPIRTDIPNGTNCNPERLATTDEVKPIPVSAMNNSTTSNTSSFQNNSMDTISDPEETPPAGQNADSEDHDQVSGLDVPSTDTSTITQDTLKDSLDETSKGITYTDLELTADASKSPVSQDLYHITTTEGESPTTSNSDTIPVSSAEELVNSSASTKESAVVPPTPSTPPPDGELIEGNTTPATLQKHMDSVTNIMGEALPDTTNNTSQKEDTTTSTTTEDSNTTNTPDHDDSKSSTTKSTRKSRKRPRPADQDDNESNPVVTKFGRTVRPPKRYLYQTVKKVSPRDPHWKEARDKEIQSLIDKDVFDVIPRSQATGKILRTRWVDTFKENDQKHTVYKSRCVVMGNFQVAGDSYEVGKTSSPVADLLSIRLLIALATELGCFVEHLDISTAYLNARLNGEQIFCYPPPGYHNDKNTIWRLKAALYGMRQAGYYWYQEISTTLKEFQLIELKVGNGIFYQHLPNAQLLIIALYVDDLLILGSTREIIANFVQQLQTKYKLKHFGSVSEYLGIHFDRPILHETNFHQTPYCHQLVSDFKLGRSSGRDIPITPKEDLHADRTITELENDCFISVTNPEKLLDERGIALYQHGVGCLQWLSIASRPDINLCVNRLQHKNHSPTYDDYEKLLHCIKYLKKHPNRPLRYTKSAPTPTTPLTLSLFYDASYSQTSDEKGITGYVLYVNNNLITWGSKRQTSILRSTYASELIALDDALVTATRVQAILKELGFSTTTINCYGDNRAVTLNVNNENTFSHSKNHNKKLKYIQEQVANNLVKVYQIGTQFNYADMFTKPFIKKDFNQACKRLHNFNYNHIETTDK